MEKNRDKIRVFKPGDFLSTCFSARKFGLCLVVDLNLALKEFPFSCEGCVSRTPAEFDTCVANNCPNLEPMKWFRKWFSEIRFEKGY